MRRELAASDDLAGKLAEARFSDLYREHMRELLGYALRRCADPDDAADVVAETFLTAWRRLADVPIGSDARLWLFGADRGRAVRATRRSRNGRPLERRRPRAVPELAGPEPRRVPRAARRAATGRCPDLARRDARAGRQGRRIRAHRGGDAARHPVAAGFDPSQVPHEGLTTDRYQVGAEVGGAVACAWFHYWGEARAAGDRAAAAEAERVLLGSEEQWPIFREMAKEGAYPAGVVEYARKLHSGIWFGRPVLQAVFSRGGLC